MKIRKGKIEDAPFLAEVVMEAVGEELCLRLADTKERLPLVTKLFTTLAAAPDSQYSYNNAFIAVDTDGKPIGGIIAYDGARLHELRRAFVREANRILGWNVTEEDAEKWGDEADKDEIYIDSLYVVSEARKQGVASVLLKAVEGEYKAAGKPLGLLVESENINALTTYRHWGFKEFGVSNFFRTPMIHMQRV